MTVKPSKTADTPLSELYDQSWTQFDSEHVCYVVQPKSGGAFKVGNAKCMSKRIGGIQSGHPELLVVRALFSGGNRTENELHRLLHDYRLCGEWFHEKAVPILCDFIRKTDLLLWGSPWTEEIYREPPPTRADWRASMRAIMLKPECLNAIRVVLSNPYHAAYKETLRLVAPFADLKQTDLDNG